MLRETQYKTQSDSQPQWIVQQTDELHMDGARPRQLIYSRVLKL